MDSCHFLFACSAAYLLSSLNVVDYTFDRPIDNLLNNRTKYAQALMTNLG